MICELTDVNFMDRCLPWGVALSSYFSSPPSFFAGKRTKGRDNWLLTLHLLFIILLGRNVAIFDEWVGCPVLNHIVVEARTEVARDFLLHRGSESASTSTFNTIEHLVLVWSFRGLLFRRFQATLTHSSFCHDETSANWFGFSDGSSSTNQDLWLHNCSGFLFLWNLILIENWSCWTIVIREFWLWSVIVIHLFF